MSQTGMGAPPAENVDGVLTETHEFRHEVQHEVNWGYVALGLAVVVAVYVLFLRESESESEERGR